MLDVVLDQEELDLLFRQKHDTTADGRWKRLIVALQELTDETTGEIEIPPRIAAKIHHYAFASDDGEKEEFLKSIFARTLGRRLGR